MSLAIGLPLRNQGELDNLLKELADPASPNFRQYLTTAQFTERFGPSEADYQTLTAFMQANGLEVTGTHPNRMILDVSGTVADIESTFHLNMVNWSHPTRGEFFAPDREPSLDAGVTILDITGLDNFVIPRPMDLKTLPLSQATPLTTGSGPGGLFIGNDFRAAYAPGVTLNGTGQAVGLFELDGFYASDVAANFKQAGLPPVPTQTVLLDGFNGAPGNANIEVTLDIMMAAYMAPGVSSIIVYEGTNWNDVLNRMATDELANQLSSSWQFSPTNATTEQIFAAMIAHGQSFFTASGDGGAYTGSIMPPADDPSVTTVGGTSLTTAGAGGPWQSETAWADSGGGVSTTWPIPAYQQKVNMAAAGGSSTMRNIPDVALTADIQMFLICNNGETISVGGTSAATPLWAGFLALANQQAAANGKPPVGFLNPPIYTIGGGSSLQTDLHDIVTGNNGRYTALPGYDLVTGWGTPAGQPLINGLTGVSNPPGFGLSASTFALSVKPGASATSTITVSPQNGFSGAVTLAAAGLPAGVTASFSPAAALTTSTLTLTAASSAPAGPSTVTITGTSGKLTSVARLVVTVTGPPTFTLSASPASVAVAPGVSSTSSITVNPLYGFTGSVSLKVAGLPAGVTGAFSPASTTGTSTLTLTASSSAALGTSSTLTVTGTSGSLNVTTTINLTVALPPSFTLSASPASLTIATGGSGASTITVTPQNGFNGTVTVIPSGVPAGVTATWSAGSAPLSVVLNLAVSASAAPGTSTVTVIGTSGSLRTTVTVSLTVSAASGFTIAPSPASVSVVQGGSSASTMTVVPQGGFSGTVSLSVTGLPAGVTGTFSPSATTHTSTLTFSASASAAPGGSTVTITGTSGSLTSKVTVALTVSPPPSFTLSATPASVSLNPGASGTSTIAIDALNGFSGTVALAASGLPAGVTASFAPASTASQSTVTFAAASTAATSSATVTITGTSGSLTSKVTIALTVSTPPSFTLSATPASVSVYTGASGASTIAINALNGFSGTVALAASGLPVGVTASFAPASTTSHSTVTFAAASTAPTSSSTVTITGTSGSVTSKVTIALTVSPPPSFTLVATPGNVSVNPGASGASTISINALNGFNGTVALVAYELPAGVTASFSPASTANHSTVTFTAASTAAAISTTVIITGTSGSLTGQGSLVLTVNPPPSFSLSATPGSVNLNPGTSGASTIAVSALSGFNGTVALAASGLPAGVTASFSPASTASRSTVTFAAASSAAASSSTVTITGTSGSLTSKVTIALAIAPAPNFTLSASPTALSIAIGATGSSTLTLTPLNGFASSVTLNVSGMPNGVTGQLSNSPTAGTLILKLAASALAKAGTSTITITGVSGGLNHTATVSLTVL